VWVQIETKESFEAIDDIVSVPGVACAFLGGLRGGGAEKGVWCGGRGSGSGQVRVGCIVLG
jgi:hypothetical protein